MKTNKNVSQETVKAIETFLAQCEKFKNAYFWKPRGNAQERARRCKAEKFCYSGDGIELNFDVDMTCNNCYVRKEVIIDGVKTTARSLRKFLKN